MRIEREARVRRINFKVRPVFLGHEEELRVYADAYTEESRYIAGSNEIKIKIREIENKNGEKNLVLEPYMGTVTETMEVQYAPLHEVKYEPITLGSFVIFIDRVLPREVIISGKYYDEIKKTEEGFLEYVVVKRKEHENRKDFARRMMYAYANLVSGLFHVRNNYTILIIPNLPIEDYYGMNIDEEFSF